MKSAIASVLARGDYLSGVLPNHTLPRRHSIPITSEDARDSKFSSFAIQTENMYEILLRSHSGLRWVVFALVLGAIFRAFTNMSSGKFTPLDDKLSLFSLISVHIQLLLGFGLYFISPVVKGAMEAGMGAAMKDSVMRFWLAEHMTGMIIGIALITIGRITAKKAATDQAKFKKIAVYFTIGLIIILATIPWPFREALGRGWF